jgi:ankyrin repeat protein
LPIVNFGKEKSILITDKLFSFKNKNQNILQMVKSKFVEKKKYQKGVQGITLNFITKELLYYNIHADDINYLEEDKLKIGKNNSSKNINIFSVIKAVSNISNNLKKNKSNIRSTLTRKINPPLSLLEKKKFFDVSKKSIENRMKYSVNSNLLLYKISRVNSLKRIRSTGVNLNIKNKLNNQYISRAMSLIHEHKIKREGTNQQLDYFEILKRITGKENIEIILRAFIHEGETLLFAEYFNNNYRRIDINSVDEDGNTFLILSIKQGLNFVTKILVEKGVDVNIQNKEGNTALHYALSGKNFDVADLLKKYGAKEDCYNSMGYTPWDCVGKSIELKGD